MAKTYDESSRKYSFPREFPTKDAALRHAKFKYGAVISMFGSQIKETFEEALEVKESTDGSGYVKLHLTRVV